MKEIKISETHYTKVSDVDYEMLSKYRWTYNKNGYAVRNGDRPGYTIYMHRVIMGLTEGDGLLVDHKNGNGLDNRRENLRVCTKTQNQYNQKPRHTSISKYKGVGYYNRDKKWRARIVVNRKDIELGKFDSELEAAKAYDAAALEHHKEYAWLNRDHFDMSG